MNLERIPPPEYPEGILSVDIRFCCPSCNRRLQIDIHAAGFETECKRCGTIIQVPVVPETVRRVALKEDLHPRTGGTTLTREEIAYLTEDTQSYP